MNIVIFSKAIDDYIFLKKKDLGLFIKKLFCILNITFIY